MNRLFWGLFFVVLDVKLNLGSAKVGLLPDFIGWFLLMKGMEALAEENRYFDRGRHWAFGLTLVHLVLYGADLLNPSGMNGVALWLLELAAFCAGMYALGKMIRGIRRMEEDHGWDLQCEKLRAMWMIQWVMGCISCLFSWMPLLGTVAVIAALVTGMCMLIAMYNTVKRYEEREK